jgi:DNA modification methylase
MHGEHQTARVGTVIDLDFGAGGHLYATHQLHAFAARCPAPVARWAIESYSAPGDVVLDPMVGSGTTLVEARLCGREAWGCDIDPLSRLIAKVKATDVDLTALDRAIASLENRLRGLDLDDSWRPDLPDVERWFRPQVAKDLSRIRHALLSSRAPRPVRDLCWVAFSSVITARTSVANARDVVHSRHHYRRWTKDPRTCERFLRRLRQIRGMVADFSKRVAEAPQRTDVRIVGSDARALPADTESVDLIFTSPPYCTALDYTRAHMFSVGWMDSWLGTSVAEYRDLGRRYVGSERGPMRVGSAAGTLPPALGCEPVDAIVRTFADDPKRAWIVQRYFADMQRVLAESARVLRPGKAMVLVVCPSNIRRHPVPTHELFVELARAQRPALEVELLVERTIHDRRRLMPYLSSAFGPRMRTEYVLVLRRDGQRASGG